MNNELQARAAHVAAIRERAEAEMKAIGIDDAFIGNLVDTFYGRILAHPELGPYSTHGFPDAGRNTWRR